MNFTISTVAAFSNTPWWLWLYVVAIGLMCALAFVASTFFKDRF